MKQHLYEPTLFLRDGKEWIKGFTMERPIHIYSDNPDWQQSKLYLNSEQYFKFMTSAAEYPVCEESFKEIKSIMRKTFYPMDSIDESLETVGVCIDDLADRLEVVDVCVDWDVIEGKQYQKQIRLRPEVKESEGFNFKTEREEFLWLQEQNRILWEFLENEGIDDRAQEFVKNYDKEFQPKQ